MQATRERAQDRTIPSPMLSVITLSASSSSSSNLLDHRPHRQPRKFEWTHLTIVGEPSDVSRHPVPKADPLLRLLDNWMADESGYDEENWPVVRQAIEEHCLSYRKKFGG